MLPLEAMRSGISIMFFVLMGVAALLHAQRLKQPVYYGTANLSTSWVNGPDLFAPKNPFASGSESSDDMFRPILMNNKSSAAEDAPVFACGFYCRLTRAWDDRCDGSLFAVFVVHNSSSGLVFIGDLRPVYVVWSANRNRVVGENATLRLTGDGDLVLRDRDGSFVWSTNTSGKSVVTMELSEFGNLLLLDENRNVVWQSFDHPTDTLLSGQPLMTHQRLTANASRWNWTEGQFFISSISDGFGAFVGSNPPQLYLRLLNMQLEATTVAPWFIQVNRNGSLVFSANKSLTDRSTFLKEFQPSALQFLRFESDGHMKLYEWDSLSHSWSTADNVFNWLSIEMPECSYPTSCGRYGVCLGKGKCKCPRDANDDLTYFKPINDDQLELGCAEVTPLSCDSMQNHRFLTLYKVSYFNRIDEIFLFSNSTNADSCKEACQRNCSCKAAIFTYRDSVSNGTCHLPTEVFSFISVSGDSYFNSTTFVKIQVPPPSSGLSLPTILGATLGALLVAILLLISIVVFLNRKKREEEEDEGEDDFKQLPGMPTRFSLEELRVATNNFIHKLGEGGFGSVFEGTLVDGIKVAVKRLDSVRQGKREFMAEVETIGSIHHLNLVRLIGFCAEKSSRLLVYEYMSNGSLDRWIFHDNEEGMLNWETRYKIIIQVAKGLLYLHDDCRQRIAHLDIKPQNILLDENFNAKVSDFGLSKLIDRDQSSVMTIMRGTPGYLAPEWLTSTITEKADVYSFGVVIVEIICGRRNLDYSQSEESVHLLRILNNKAIEGRLLDIIGICNSYVQKNEEEAVKMLKLAIWCLQSDTTKRPSMSTVVKVLEELMDVIPDLEYNFLNFANKIDYRIAESSGSAPLLSSITEPR